MKERGRISSCERLRWACACVGILEYVPRKNSSEFCAVGVLKMSRSLFDYAFWNERGATRYGYHIPMCGLFRNPVSLALLNGEKGIGDG